MTHVVGVAGNSKFGWFRRIRDQSSFAGLGVNEGEWNRFKLRLRWAGDNPPCEIRRQALAHNSVGEKAGLDRSISAMCLPAGYGTPRNISIDRSAGDRITKRLPACK